MPNRLPWRPHPEGGFIAYPDGEEHADRFARLERNASSGSIDTWNWRCRHGPAIRYGAGNSRQEAADEATEAWPAMAPLAEELEAAARAQRDWDELIAAAIASGDA